MQDFPVFTTDSGVSSLILREIPYRREAYIRIQDVQENGFAEHLRECVSFCRMCGAEAVYASGHGLLEDCPLHVIVYEMSGEATVDRDTLKNLFPVTEATVTRWRTLYNERMGPVDNSATLTGRDESNIVASGGAYFVHDAGKLLGIGWMEDGDPVKLLAIASVERGAGSTVFNTLMSLVEGTRVTLEVVSTNTRAIQLYERMGFLVTGELRRWYRV